MARDDAKVIELRQVAQELDRRQTRFEAELAQLEADKADVAVRAMDAELKRAALAEDRLNLERVIRLFSDDRVTTRGQ